MTDLLIKILLPLSLAVIMFGIGMTLTSKDFSLVFKNSKAVLIGLFIQIALFPLFAFALAIFFDLDPILAIGLIIIAACPGGATSNIISQICNGNVALSVSLTAITSFTGIISINILTPIALNYFRSKTDISIELPLLDTIIRTSTITILPILLGMTVRKHKANFASRMENPMRISSTLIFILIFIGVVLTNFNTLGNALKKAGLVTFILNMSIISSGFILAKIFKLNFRNAISISVDASIQNATLGLVICTTILNSVEMAIPTAAYTISMYITGGVLMWILSSKKSTS